MPENKENIDELKNQPPIQSEDYLKSPGTSSYDQPLSNTELISKYQQERDQTQKNLFQLSGGIIGAPDLSTAPDFNKVGAGGERFPYPVKDPEIGKPANFAPDDPLQKALFDANQSYFNLANTVASTPEYASNDFKFASPISGTFGAGIHMYNAKRYQIHGDYDRLGFSPWRDNEDYYNTFGSDWNDFWRAAGGFWGNMATGYKSWWRTADGVKDYQDVDSASEFMGIHALRSSTKEGVLPFLGNTVSQVGLGVGMLAGWATESMAVTAATGGLGGPAAIGRGIARVPRAFRMMSLIPKFNRTRNFLNSIRQVGALRTTYNLGKSGVVGIGKTLTPNMVNWGRSITSAKDLAQWSKLSRGFGAFYRDAGLARMAISEAALEGGIVRMELETRLVDEFREVNGREPTVDEMEELKSVADQGAKSTMLANMPILLATNTIVFGKAFKPFSAAVYKKLGGREMIRGVTGKMEFAPIEAGKPIATTFTPKAGILKRAKDTLLTPRSWGRAGLNLGRGFINYTKANMAEGVQEFLQEVIADSAMDYHSNAYWGKIGDPDVGAAWDIGLKNVQKYMSPAGGEIFLSGFLMGGIMGGGTSVIQGGKTQLVKRGWADAVTGGKFKFKDKYDAYMEKKMELEKQVGETFTEVTKDPLKYFSPDRVNYFAQKEMAKDQEVAAEEGDKKGYFDIKDNSDFAHIATMVESGKMDFMREWLGELKTLSVDEFNQATQANVQTKEEQFALVDNMLKQSKAIEERYKEAQTRFPNEFQAEIYPYGSDAYQREAIQQIAHQSFVRQYVMAGHKFDRSIERRTKIVDKLRRTKLWKKSGKEIGEDIKPLLDDGSLDFEITLLNGEVAELRMRDAEGILTKEEKTELINKEQKVELFSAYKDAVKRYKDAISNIEVQKDEDGNLGKYSPEQIAEQRAAVEQLVDAFTEAIEFLAEKDNGYFQQAEVEKYFEDIKDLIELEVDATNFNMAINYLSSPETYVEQMERMTAILQRQHEIRAEVAEKHRAAFMERAENGGFLQDLDLAGFYLDEAGLESIFENLEVPEYVFTKQDDKQHTKGTPKYAEAAQMVDDFLTAVKREGLTAEEYDAKLAAEKAEAEAAEAEETDEDVDVEELELVQLVDEAGNSAYDTWAGIETVDGRSLQEVADELFEKAQEKQKKLGQEFDDIHEWVRSSPASLRTVVQAINDKRAAEFDEKQKAKQQKKKKAVKPKKKAPKKAEPVVVKEGEIVEVEGKRYKKFVSPDEEIGEYYMEVDENGENVDGMPIKKEWVESRIKPEETPPAEPPTDRRTEIENEIEALQRQKKDAIRGSKDTTQDKKSRAEWAAEADRIQEEIDTLQEELDALEAQVDQFADELVDWRPPTGVPIIDTVNAVVDQLLANQKNIKTLSSIVDNPEDEENAELIKKFNLKEGQHGYLVKNRDGEWVRATSVTQTIGSTFEIRVNNRVKIRKGKHAGKVGVVVEDPDMNSARLIEEDPTGASDTFLVKLDGVKKPVEVTGGNIENLTFVDSRLAGTRLDKIVRDYFLGKISDKDPAPAGIDQEAYDYLIGMLSAADKYFEEEGLTVIANNIVLYDLDAPGGPVAGEMDLLLYNKETGEFSIYDMKTKATKFWAVSPAEAEQSTGLKKKEPTLAADFLEEKTNRRGLKRSKKEGYRLQQAVYKAMFQKQYGVAIGTPSESGINLMPFHIVYERDGTGHIKNINWEDKIALEDIDVSKYVNVVDVPYIGQVEGGRTVTPEFFAGAPTMQPGEKVVVDMPFTAEHTEGIASGQKATTLRSKKATPAQLQRKLGNAITYINGKRHLLISHGTVIKGEQVGLEINEAGKVVKAIAERTMKEVNRLKKAGRPSDFVGQEMSEYTAQKILDVDKMDISEEDKNKLRLIISENLPTELPEEWKKAKANNPITVAGTTYYARFKQTTNWLRGKGKLYVIQVIEFPEMELKPEDIEATNDAFEQWADEIINFEGTEAEFNALKKRVHKWIQDTSAEKFGVVSNTDKVYTLLETKALAVAESTPFAGVTPGDILTINQEEIGNFGERVVVKRKFGNYVTVENVDDPSITTKEDGKLKTISKSKFDEVVMGVNEQGTDQPVIQPEEQKAGEQNMEVSTTLTREQLKQATEEAKNMTEDDALNDLLHNSEC